jgi:hypothetical protein
MNFDRVTITGADDSVSVSDLAAISHDYPFVEWAILFSPGKVGMPRLPSVPWTRDLADCSARCEMNLAAHLCGGYTREMLKGNGHFFVLHPWQSEQFGRVQLNFGGRPQDKPHGGFALLLEWLRKWDRGTRQWIFQIDGVNNDLFTLSQFDGRDIDRVPLYDLSHGRGVVAGRWPRAIDWIYQGYAGGLGPQNIESELSRIAESAGESRFWVDMETGVRSEDGTALDLAKVVRVLDYCASLIQRQKANT